VSSVLSLPFISSIWVSIFSIRSSIWVSIPSIGTAFLQVREGQHLSVGALLRRELSACVGWVGGVLFCKELGIPDGETVQWDLLFELIDRI
jgi:TctA family transporter